MINIDALSSLFNDLDSSVSMQLRHVLAYSL